MKTTSLFTILTLMLLLTAGAVQAQQADRSGPPEPGPVKSLTLPEIERFTLSNGLPVVMMQKTGLPLVQVDMLFHFGSVHDPDGKLGLVNALFGMLNEGAGGKSSLELADAIDYLGATIGTGAGRHASSVSLNTTVGTLDDALALFTDVVLRPDFPEEELERQKLSQLTSLIQRHDNPNSIANAAFWKILYPEGHPYGLIQSKEDIASIGVEDLKAFHAQYFNPVNATLIVVGDISSAEAKEKLEDRFGKWNAGDAISVLEKEVEQVENRTIRLIDKPGSAQSVIRIGRIGAARDTGDYYPLIIANTILGGSFAARLNQNLREEHGYTYGAGSQFLMYKHRGPFLAYSSVQTEVTDSALYQFFKEFDEMAEPVSEEELQRAQNYTALGFPRAFETIEGIAGRLQDMVLYDLPEDYFNTYVGNIMTVTVDDVQRVVEQYINPATMEVIVVGDKEKVIQTLETLGLGDVVNYSVEDILGPVPTME